MLIAFVRSVSPRLAECELTFLERRPIDLALAFEQHARYVETLNRLGAQVIVLPAAPELADGVFVEDTAVVLDEVAVIARPGAPSRRPEIASVAEALSAYRPLHYLVEPATLDGGDVFRAGDTIFAGLSQRTNPVGVEQLRRAVEPHGYVVKPVPVAGCLHLKSAATYLGRNTILVNRDWIDGTTLEGFDLIDVAPGEPWAADTLVIGDVVLLPSGFPRTTKLLESQGFRVQTIDLSELQKAEAGVSCMSIILESEPRPQAIA